MISASRAALATARTCSVSSVPHRPVQCSKAATAPLSVGSTSPLRQAISGSAGAAAPHPQQTEQAGAEDRHAGGFGHSNIDDSVIEPEDSTGDNDGVDAGEVCDHVHPVERGREKDRIDHSPIKVTYYGLPLKKEPY